MVRKLKIYLPSTALVLAFLLSANLNNAKGGELNLEATDSQCQDYHMTNLKAMWRDKLKKASAKYQIYGNAVKDAKSAINKLHNDISWLGYKATDPAALNIGMSAAGIHAMANLTNNLLKLHPGYKAAQIVAPWQNRLVYAIEKVGSALASGTKEMVYDIAEDAILSGLQEKYVPIAQSAATIDSLIGDVKRMKDMPDQQKHLKKEVSRSLDRLMGQLDDYYRAQQRAGRDIDNYQKIEAAVRKFCGEPEDEIEEIISNSQPAPPPRTEADRDADLDAELAALSEETDTKAEKKWQDTTNIDYSSDAYERALQHFKEAVRTSNQLGMRNSLAAMKAGMQAWSQAMALRQGPAGSDIRCQQATRQIQAYKKGIRQLDTASYTHRQQKQLWETGVKGNQQWFDAHC